MSNRIYDMSFAKIYPMYVEKAKKKNRTADEVDQLIFWLTGYDEKTLKKAITDELTFAEFFEYAPSMNPNRHKINGSICGVKIAQIKEPIMKDIRYLDKIIDELAKGKSLDKIYRE